MDELTSVLDPTSTLRVEELVQELKESIQLLWLHIVCNKLHAYQINCLFLKMVTSMNMMILIKFSPTHQIKRQKIIFQEGFG